MLKVIVALALCSAGTAVKLPAALEDYTFEQFQKDFKKTYAAEEVWCLLLHPCLYSVCGFCLLDFCCFWSHNIYLVSCLFFF